MSERETERPGRDHPGQEDHALREWVLEFTEEQYAGIQRAAAAVGMADGAYLELVIRTLAQTAPAHGGQLADEPDAGFTSPEGRALAELRAVRLLLTEAASDLEQLATVAVRDGQAPSAAQSRAAAEATGRLVPRIEATIIALAAGGAIPPR